MTQMSKQNPPIGSLCFFDLASTDLDKTRKFYGDVFGWKFAGQGGYEFINDGSPDGGALIMGGLRQCNENGGVLTYINVASIEETARKVKQAGGKILKERIDVPGYGAFVVFQAPGGPVQAAWQAAKAA
jgi:predicted enzyme related to lactoylglutathione lyase